MPDPYRFWLLDARLRSRLTQRQIAQRAGVSVSAYQKYEYGPRTPLPPVQRRIARALGLKGEHCPWHGQGFSR